MTVEKTGPWQVTVHTPKNPSTAYLWIMGGGGSQFVWPKEWLPKYGTNNDWKVQVGTGPYKMTDWVDNSVLTMVRNNNYWDKNPIRPGQGRPVALCRRHQDAHYPRHLDPACRPQNGQGRRYVAYFRRRSPAKTGPACRRPTRR